MKTHQSEFQCPKCNGELDSESQTFICKDCSAKFPTNDGIVDFRCHRKDYYFNPIPMKAMDELIQDMDGLTWPAIVKRFLEQTGYNDDWLDNLVADGRYAWKVLLNLTPETVLLDLGCGLGNLTSNIVPHVSRVYAMDLTYQRVQFASRRLKRFKPKDDVSFLAAGDGTYLPFPDSALDCVVLSGVLEWVGEDNSSWRIGQNKLIQVGTMIASCFGKKTPRRMQLAFLREIRRVLKPEGQLFIAIENRTNYQYFRGRLDHHSKLKYGSLLPRFLANAYSVLVNRRPYRTYTYSIYGYKRLLANAGFRNFNFFGLAPGYSHLAEIFPVETSASNWVSRRYLNFKDRVASSKYLVPAYGIVTTPSTAMQPRLLDQLTAHIQSRLLPPHAGNPLRIISYRVTSKEKGVLTADVGGTGLIIKLPFNEAALAEEERNRAVLIELRKGQQAANSWVPSSLFRGQCNCVDYIVEEKVPGVSLRESLVKLGRTQYLKGIEAALTKLNPGEPKMAVKEALIGEIYRNEVGRQLDIVFQVIPDEATRRALKGFFSDRLYGEVLHLGLRHGDFSASNVFVKNGQISGLIDWGASSVKGISILDSYNYLDSVHCLFNLDDHVSDSVRLLATRQWPVHEEQRFLERQYERYGIEEKHHKPLVYLYWLHHIAHRLTSRMIFNVPEIKADVESIVKDIIAARDSAAS